VRFRVNYEELIKNRYPGGAYDARGPPMEVKRRSKVIEDLVDYQRFRDDKCRNERERTFLQDKITGEFMWREPDWAEVGWGWGRGGGGRREQGLRMLPTA
jgi:hypothetical protein